MEKTKIKKCVTGTALIISTIVIAFIAAGICSEIFSKTPSDADISAYYSISADDTEALFEISDSEALIFDSKAYGIFEASCLGNRNMSLIASGYYCEKGNVVCKSGENTVLLIDGAESVINENPSSYIGIIDDVVYFRDDAERKLYRYSISENKQACIVDSECGEVVVSRKGIAYIEKTTSALKYIPDESDEAVRISELRIKSFAVIGNKYFALTDSGEFGIMAQNGDFKRLDSDVDRFICNGKVAIQKGNNIYFIDENGASQNSLRDVEGVIIGFDENKLYVYEKSGIMSYDTTDTESFNTVTELNENDVLKGFYIADETFELLTYTPSDTLYKLNYQEIPK